MLIFLSLIIAASLVNNIVLQHLFGISPLLAVAKRLEIAVDLGIVMIYLATASSVVIYLLNIGVFPLIKIISFRSLLLVLCLYSIIQLADKPIKQAAPYLAETSERFKALLTMNSTLLAVGLLSLKQDYGLIGAVAFGLGSGLGFALVLLAFTTIDSRLQVADLPEPVKGLSIQLLTLGILSMAFMGFTGLVKI